MPARVKATFIAPMLLQRTDRLSEGTEWSYELKSDGYRAIAFKTGGKVHHRSRNDNDFTEKYPSIAESLVELPADTVIDGEIVGFDEEGRPSFNILQNGPPGPRRRSLSSFSTSRCCAVATSFGSRWPRDVNYSRRRSCRHSRRRARYMPPLDAPLDVLIHSVKTQGFEGLTAKRLDGCYEPGERSGAWQKMRVNRGQDFVIGG